MRSIKVSGWFLVAAVAAVAVFVGAESFTDVNSAQYWGKTGLPALTAAIDANFAMIEDGLSGEPVAATTLSASGATTLSGSVTVIGGGVTSRWDNAASLIDGEMIAADTIDDDSIDFSDVTGADLTLTDCGAITSSGAIQGTSLRLSATQYFAIVSATQLVFVSGAVTNVLDADIGTP